MNRKTAIASLLVSIAALVSALFLGGFYEGRYSADDEVSITPPANLCTVACTHGRVPPPQFEEES